jgi:maltose/moltooligosaccharide transporter
MAESITPALKPKLSIAQILQMNLGFLGLQFSFGLQQANMSPIWGYLEVEEKNFALLSIAGPLAGLIVQPIVGVMSDRTDSKWGRRTPYFLVGAIMCALGLFLMPLSGNLKPLGLEITMSWLAAVIMAFSVLFLLDVGNNITMEPYRAYVNDRLNEDQRGFGFLSQSAFTGLAQTLAYLSPSLLVGLGISKTGTGQGVPSFVLVSFWIGAFLSIATILWSILRVPELPLTQDERAKIAAMPKGIGSTFTEIWEAIREMPGAMRTMVWMSLFQWYAMMTYWTYVNNSVARSVFDTTDNKSVAFQESQLLYGQAGAFYNFIAFLAALFVLPKLARQFGAAKLHAACLVAAALSMLIIPQVSQDWALFIAVIGIGIGWASIMGNPYIVLANSIPPERTGVYMGIFNMMICAPMILFAFTMPGIYGSLLSDDPRNALTFGGVLMLGAAISIALVKSEAGKAMAKA